MPEKPNNSNDNSLQPYNPSNGEYSEDDGRCDLVEFYLLKIDGKTLNHKLSFPDKPAHNKEYKSYYFNNCINWGDVDIQKDKMLFLVDSNSPKQRYLDFRNRLGFNETNINELEKQIRESAKEYFVYLCKKEDEFGFRVKIYMPIYSADKKIYMIIRTGWLIKKGEKPRFVTAFYEKDYERNMKDEI